MLSFWFVAVPIAFQELLQYLFKHVHVRIFNEENVVFLPPQN